MRISIKNIQRISLLLLLALASCAPPPDFRHENAAGHYASDIQQCAPYARKISGINLYGDADSWWQGARGHYARGNMPQEGAALVLKKTSRMHAGHVAIVKKIRNSREIFVAHSNWGSSRKQRHIIYDAMLVTDVSPMNDWTEVKFWNDEKNVFGFSYGAYGFIYP